MLAGGLAGLIVGLIVTFVLALLDARAQGMSAGSCIVYGCVLTLLLSQAVGLPGMLAGGVVGALTGSVVGWAHHRTRTAR
jgi:hypothetical protein